MSETIKYDDFLGFCNGEPLCTRPDLRLTNEL